MISTLFFVFLLLLENLILPALIGPGSFSIVPLFLISMLVYSPNTRIKIFQIVLLTVISELFSGVALGSFLIPLMITALIYIWLNRFLNIDSGLQENSSILGLLMGSIVISLIFYSYSLLFIFFKSSYYIAETIAEIQPLFTSSIVSVMGWSIAFTVISKYVLKTK